MSADQLLRQADAGEVIRSGALNGGNDLIFDADYAIVDVIGKRTATLLDDSLVLYSDRAALGSTPGHNNGFIELDYDDLKNARGLFLIQERQNALLST